MSKKSEMIGFKTTPEVRAMLEDIAKKEDRSVSYIINKILTKELTDIREVAPIVAAHAEVNINAVKGVAPTKALKKDVVVPITVDIGGKK